MISDRGKEACCLQRLEKELPSQKPLPRVHDKDVNTGGNAVRASGSTERPCSLGLKPRDAIDTSKKSCHGLPLLKKSHVNGKAFRFEGQIQVKNLCDQFSFPCLLGSPGSLPSFSARSTSNARSLPILAPNAMETPPFLPDPAQLHIPLETFSAVSHALSDLAHFHASAELQEQPRQEEEHALEEHGQQQLQPPASSSTPHVAQRLASIIRRVSHTSEDAPDADPVPRSDVFSEPTPPVLALELAAVSALGVWADCFLPPTALRSVCRCLSSSLSAVAKSYILHSHVDSPSIRTLATPAAARRAVFRQALAKRYGRLPDAPSAFSIAGAPYVLYVHQALPACGRVHTPPRLGKQEVSDTVNLPASDGYNAWRVVTQGVAVFEHVAVPAEEVTRAAVAAKLKDAVSKRGLSPTLMIVEAGLDTTLCAAADVLRAVCDTYGMHMHVEGDALPMIMAGKATKNLLYNVGDLVRVANSAVLEVAKWFGRYEMAVLLYCEVETVGNHAMSPLGAPGDLSAVMSLWFFLQRVQLPRGAALVRAACEHTNTLTECLYSVPHLIECKTVGCGASVVVSYAAVDADAESRAGVNRAMLAHFQRRHRNMRQLLALASHENRQWLLFSPTRVLSQSADSRPCSAAVVKEICKDLIYAARRCELVVKGKAAFMSEMRQCHDVEVEGLTSQQMGGGFSPLFFAALRVTPFGEVSRNGHWKKEEEMSVKVEKYTYALASLVESNPSEEFEAVVHESDTVNDAPVVCIGPVLPEPSTDPTVSEMEDEGCIITENHTSLPEASAAYAEKWDLDELAAQELALKAAECVTAVVYSALSTEEEPSSSPKGVAMEGIERSQVMYQEEDNEDEAVHVDVSSVYVPQSSEALPVVKAEFGDSAKPGEMSHEMPFFGRHLETEDAVPGNQRHQDEQEDVKGKVRNAETEETADVAEDPRQEAKETGLRKRSTGFWGLLFGEETREDAESCSSIESTKALEDDYFRP